MKTTSTLLFCITLMLCLQAVHSMPNKHYYQPCKHSHIKDQPNRKNSASTSGSFKGKLTFYNVENDACGTHSKNTDMVAALNKPQYGDLNKKSKYCGKCAQIKGDRATVVVKIVDACPECKKGSLDLSKTAFKKTTNADGEAEDISWLWVSCDKLNK